MAPQPARSTRGELPDGTPSRSLETRERLLDAAEQLFAERGFDGTSMRALAARARASISAANYHFGSKEGLLRAALLRRVEPVNHQRLERLDALEREAGGAVAVEEIFDAYLRPIFGVRAARGGARHLSGHVAARLYADPSELMASLKRELTGPVSQRFLVALGRALPERSAEDLELAHQFTMGMLMEVIRNQPEGPTSETGYEPVLRKMIAYASAGLRALAETDPS